MSKVAWLDYDGGAREKALQLLSAFQKRESRDELGLGTIRDALSDMLFPGTSTVQTRLRYMLFVPWMFRELEERGESGASFLRRADEEERRLVKILKAGRDSEGVIGARSGEYVKRLPSDIYWAGLGVWGIRQREESIEEYGRGISAWRLAEKAYLAAKKKRRAFEDAEGSVSAPEPMWCTFLPVAPPDFPKNAAFELTRDEALFLQGKILALQRGSLLETLAQRRYNVEVAYPWELDFPEHREVLGHARTFAHVTHGATVLYNVLLARRRLETTGASGDDENLRRHEEELNAWMAKMSIAETAKWDVDSFFRIVPGIPRRTREFVRTWRDCVVATGGKIDVEAAIRLVRIREQSLKGPRSRFTNASALEKWGGTSGGLPIYRWHRVHRFMLDLYDGLEAD